MNKIDNVIFSPCARIKAKMTTSKEREVNVVSMSTEKEEVIHTLSSDDEYEDVVLCKMCCKEFVSEMALMNHARVEHLDEYVAGEKLCVKQTYKKRKVTQEDEERLKIKTAPLISRHTIDNTIIIKNGQPEIKKIKQLNAMEKKVVNTVVKEKEMKIISGPFECLQPSSHNSEDTCHQIFQSCCEYSTHYRDQHRRRRLSLKCIVCEKLLEIDKLYPRCCKVCGMSFPTTNDLKDHTQTAHIKLKPFQCNICLKRFTQQAGVQQHMRMHSGDRPFKCTFCPKVFIRKDVFNKHLRIHTKIKPYRCIICGKSFSAYRCLQNHMRTHTNVAPFECGICHKRFKQASNLNSHVKLHNKAAMSEDQKKKYATFMKSVDKSDRRFEVEVKVEVDAEDEGVLGHVESVASVESVDDVESVENVDNIGNVENFVISGLV